MNNNNINQVMLLALQRIAKIDPAYDSDEGYNEWGEAECFRQTQAIANAALMLVNAEQGKKQ